MKLKFLNSTLALACLAALLYWLGYIYDVSYLTHLHLPLTVYLPPTYLEIARPFYLAFVRGQPPWQVFAALSALVVIVGILSASWPPFQRNLHRITTFLRRIPLGVYVLTAVLGYIALTRWLANFGWTTADQDIDMIASKDYPDWTITLRGEPSIRGHYVRTSDCCYVVICRDESNTVVRTIPQDSVLKIEYDTSIK